MSDTGIDGVYDENNIFAQIISGNLPCHKVYEDEVIISFMDVFPQAPGHVLVVPKQKARNLLDYPPQMLGELMQRVQKIAKAIKKSLNPDGISMFQFSGAAGGQSVFHLHFHLVPRLEGALLKGHGNIERADNAELATFAKQIGAAIGD